VPMLSAQVCGAAREALVQRLVCDAYPEPCRAAPAKVLASTGCSPSDGVLTSAGELQGRALA
jgi:hypothetical protein